MGKYVDVDALLKEAGIITEEKPSLKAFGETWTLRSEVPAGLGLKIMRMSAVEEDTEDTATVADQVEENVSLLRELFDPAEQVDELLNVAGFASIGIILQVALGVMFGENPDAVTHRILHGGDEADVTEAEKKE